MAMALATIDSQPVTFVHALGVWMNISVQSEISSLILTPTIKVTGNHEGQLNDKTMVGEGKVEGGWHLLQHVKLAWSLL